MKPRRLTEIEVLSRAGLPLARTATATLVGGEVPPPPSPDLGSGPARLPELLPPRGGAMARFLRLRALEIGSRNTIIVSAWLGRTRRRRLCSENLDCLNCC